MTAEVIATITGFKLNTYYLKALFESGAPPVAQRIEALGTLHAAGISTFAMIAPLLPGAESLVEILAGKVDHVLIDRLNYHYADWAFKKHDMQWAMKDVFFLQKGEELRAGFEKAGFAYRKLF